MFSSLRAPLRSRARGLGPATLLALLLCVAPAARAEVATSPAVSHPSAEALQSAKAHYKLGAAHLQAGAYAAAVEEFEAAFRVYPNPLFHFNLAQAYRLSGDRAQAIAHYMQFLEVRREGPDADEARVRVATLTAQKEREQAKAPEPSKAVAATAEIEPLPVEPRPAPPQPLVAVPALDLPMEMLESAPAAPGSAPEIAVAAAPPAAPQPAPSDAIPSLEPAQPSPAVEKPAGEKTVWPWVLGGGLVIGGAAVIFLGAAASSSASYPDSQLGILDFRQ